MAKSEQTHRVFRVIEKANQIADLSEVGEMLSQMAELIKDVCQAGLIIVYFSDVKANNTLSLRTVVGNKSLYKSSPSFQQKSKEIAEMVLEKGAIQELDTTQEGEGINNIITIPIRRNHIIDGVIQVVNYHDSSKEILKILGDRIAHEVHQKTLIEAGIRRSNRLEALMDLLGQISSTLDRDKILGIIIDFSHTLLDAQAGSLFLEDEVSGDLIMQISTDYGRLSDDLVRVPAGKGIIGYVVDTGEAVIVNDA
ncbi:MAG: hypothetical protein MUO76_13240, partial [Anaerolineaceae bacterium]|nr:hypothetical protein [Anaerolineaceae bacterium]